jgi:hypothetical protein
MRFKGEGFESLPGIVRCVAFLREIKRQVSLQRQQLWWDAGKMVTIASANPGTIRAGAKKPALAIGAEEWCNNAILSRPGVEMHRGHWDSDLNEPPTAITLASCAAA